MIAYVVTSRWDQPSCLLDRFKTLPSSHSIILADREKNIPRYFLHEIPVKNLSRIRGMRGKTSKDVKKQFIHWLVHSPFSGAWHIEDDMMCREKNWTLCIQKAFNKTLTEWDLVAKTHPETSRFYCKSCSVCRKQCNLIHWPFLYISKRFAIKIYNMMLRGETGHHEVFTYGACEKINCNLYNATFPGIFLKTAGKKITPNNEMLQHPRKCSRMK